MIKPRIIAVDYGIKRVGLAVTDPLGLIATPLKGIETHKVVDFLKHYIQQEAVEEVVVGKPLQMNNQPSEIETDIVKFIKLLLKQCPNLRIIRFDERFTSKLAQHTLFESGLSKKKRRDKLLIDRTSAVILLQSYLEHKNLN